jgi:hypothetical protein
MTIGLSWRVTCSVTVPLLTSARSHQRMIASVFPTSDGHALGPAGAGVGDRAKLRFHGGAGRGDDGDGVGVPGADGAEDVEHEREVAPELVGTRAGHDRQAGRPIGERGRITVERRGVRGLVEQKVADELGRYVAPLKEAFLERQQAEHEVGAPPELVDAPASPRPDLRSDEVHDADAALLGDCADREVRGR